MDVLQLKIALPLLLLLQLLFLLLGIAYNAASILQTRSGERPLTPNSPVAGGLGLLIYGLCLTAGFNGSYLLYRGLMALFLFLIGYVGIIRHCIGYARTPELYTSGLSWFVAVAINLFGTLLNLLAATGRFTTVMN